ncbi:MAG: DUF4170 domain-containing protein [Magnetospirillum sp.]
MAKKFYVVGGEYADTTFTTIAAGHKEECFGPFGMPEEAHVCWRALTGKTVDNAMIRYSIRADEDQSDDSWYVVGGEYADTSFDVIADGKTLEVHGPFDRTLAMNKWRELTGKTVDNAMMRYDLCSAAELPARKG